MLEFRQVDFSAGMDLFAEDYALGASSYGLANNIRNRTGALTPIAGPVEDTDAPAGLKQGVYAFDDYIILFCNGAAYYKNIVTSGAWTQISGFALSTTANYVYAEAVPASKSNYVRKLQDEERIDGTSSETNVNTSPTLINTSDAGLVCQDGVSQGFFILPNGTARQLQTYDQWTTSAREYVPVMAQMKYVNGILFGVAKDGVTIYRSVSGRPLDFVVNITTAGLKGGDAATTAYNVSYSPITCLASLNSGELFVATLKGCHPIEFNYDRTIFAEPTFLNRKSFSAGVMNQHSFIDNKLGDYQFIDLDGLRSYNAVATLNNEGRNSIFSSQISKALTGVTQSVTATIVFDNYSIFAVNTIYGNRLAIYDNTRAIWVCFDNLGLDGPIKQFAVANQSNSPILYAITAAKIYKLYQSATELEATVYLKAITSGRARTNIQLTQVCVAFDGGTTEAEASVTQIVNNQVKETVTRGIAADEDGSVDNIVFDHKSAKQGWKVQLKLTWQNEAKVTIVEAIGQEHTNNVTLKHRAQVTNT